MRPARRHLIYHFNAISYPIKFTNASRQMGYTIQYNANTVKDSLCTLGEFRPKVSRRWRQKALSLAEKAGRTCGNPAISSFCGTWTRKTRWFRSPAPPKIKNTITALRVGR